MNLKTLAMNENFVDPSAKMIECDQNDNQLNIEKNDDSSTSKSKYR